MMTNKLKQLFLLSIPLFVAHGLEEMLTGLYNIDSHVAFMFGWLANLPTMQALFILFQVMLWLVLIVGYLLLRGPKWQLRLMFVVGFVFVYELHHLYKVVVTGGYYPGLLTAIPLYIVGYLFWKELLRNHKPPP